MRRSPQKIFVILEQTYIDTDSRMVLHDTASQIHQSLLHYWCTQKYKPPMHYNPSPLHVGPLYTGEEYSISMLGLDKGWNKQKICFGYRKRKLKSRLGSTIFSFEICRLSAKVVSHLCQLKHCSFMSQS